MSKREIDKKLKQIEQAVKNIHPDNPVAISATAQYRYLMNLRQSNSLSR